MSDSEQFQGAVRRRRLRLPQGARVAGAAVLLLVAHPRVAWESEASISELSPADVLTRMQQSNQTRSADLNAYTSRRHYRLENERFHKSAQMTVWSEYRRPGVKSFRIESEAGDRVIRDKVLHRLLESEGEAAEGAMRAQTAITPENYTFHFAGCGFDRGRPSYLFDITPRHENKFMVQGRVWLDAEDFAITQVAGRPAKSPSFWIRSTHFVHMYNKHGRFWLAASNVSDSDSFWFGHTRIEIRYDDYSVNAGGKQ